MCQRDEPGTVAGPHSGGRRFQDLPLPPTPLIDRERELDELCARLRGDDVRLLTLTGTGGSGKTRLALSVAAALNPDFPDGVCFVDLTPLHDPALVVSAIAQALGVRDGAGVPPGEALRRLIRHKRLLVLLDNFEHLLDAAPEVARLLEVAAGLKVLVTSRAPLHLRWEHRFPVEPLALPDLQRLPAPKALAAVPAVALFVQRVEAVRPDFRLTAANAHAVADVCVRLDGLPLAIELAAARGAVLSPPALLAHLATCLDALPVGPRDLPARQQTLRATLAWSYDLLTAAEQMLFRRLAVFAGGGPLDAVAAVCDADGDLGIDILDGLASLVDHSLLRQDERADGRPGFVMLHTVREYAWERLDASGEAVGTRRRHADRYLALAEEARPKLTGPEHEAWLARLAAEHDNLRAALAWWREHGEVERELRLAGALWWFWLPRGHLSDGRGWLEGALAGGGDVSARTRAVALVGAGYLAWRQGDFDQTAALGEESLALWRELGERGGTAWALNLLALAAWRRGDLERAAALGAQGLALFRAIGDAWGMGSALHAVGHIALVQGDATRAAAHLEESLMLWRGLRGKGGAAIALNGLALVALAQGDYPRAAALGAEGLALSREMGDRWGVAYILQNLGTMAKDHGDYDRAAAFLRESLTGMQDLGEIDGYAACLAGLGAVADARGEPERAARLFGAAEAALVASGGVMDPGVRAAYDRDVAAVRAHIDEAAFTAAQAVGRAMPLPQTIADALVATEPAPGTAAASLQAPSPASLPPPREGARGTLPDGLTAREVEVLRLLAAGKTNREIADKLVLSVGTVEKHIANLYSKIGARGRADATAYAIRHGLAALDTP